MKAIQTLSLCFLVFLLGTFFQYYKIPPASFFTNAFQAAQAYVMYLSQISVPYSSFIWKKDPYPTEQGVTTYKTDSALNGYTLYSSAHEQSALLIDMNGEVVHRWHMPFHSLLDEQSSVQDPVPPRNIYMRKAYLYPNGDLLAVYEGMGDTPYGYGLAKMNKDSELIWKYMGHTHHDVDVAPNGRVFAIEHQFAEKTEFIELLKQQPDFGIHHYWYLNDVILEDGITILEENGRQLKRISVLKALIQSEYSKLLKASMNIIPQSQSGDLFHVNSVQVITPEVAAASDIAENGQILVSLREPHLIGLIDIESEKFTWIQRGGWIKQHDPEFMANGEIMLFDNLGDLPEGSSRVIAYDPQSKSIKWSFEGSAAEDFLTKGRGSQQRLKNGNILLTESHKGRIIEVTPENEIVWEYKSPHKMTHGDRDLVAIICEALRFTSDDLDFSFNHGKTTQ